MHSTRTLSRPQRTAAQAAPSAMLLLVVNYILDQFGVDIPETVLVATYGLLMIAASKIQAFAEYQGWIKNRQSV